jgi:hypothetical protein
MCLDNRRVGKAGTLTSGQETTESMRVRGDVLFELLDEQVDETVIKIFISKVGITSSSLDLAAVN